jgi:hypothetical protein
MQTLKDIDEPEYIVTKNSDSHYKTDNKWTSSYDIKEINAFEIEMLKGTQNPIEFMENEKKEEPIFRTDEEIREIEIKNICTEIRILALHEMNKHVLMNISDLNKNEKNEYSLLRNKYKKEYDEGIDIKSKFNKICTDKLFFRGVDISTYPVHN